MAHTQANESLRGLRPDGLSIIRLAEPLTSAASPNDTKRCSGASADASENPTPASLAADLSHYRELFSKLRFSYLEQVTKEKFLRAIVGDPPLIVEHEDNVELEKQLAIAKADLKAQKEETAAMTAELEAMGKNLSHRYEEVQLWSSQLETLPSEIYRLEECIAALHNQQQEDAAQSALSLPLPATLDLLSQSETECEELDRQIRKLQNALPKKTRELERLESGLKPLQAQKTAAILSAKEAMRRKEQGEGGMGDDLEMKGRWFGSASRCLEDVLA